MNRRLPSFAALTGAQAPSWLIVGTLGALLAGTLMVSRSGEPPTPEAPVTAHPASSDDEPGWDCRVQGNRVCGMEGPGTYTAPDGGSYVVVPGDYVYTGPMSWTYQGATVSAPGLAESIADRCADTPDALLDCVGAIIGQRMEHRP